jgi:hypothetical protein
MVLVRWMMGKSALGAPLSNQSPDIRAQAGPQLATLAVKTVDKWPSCLNP